MTGSNETAGLFTLLLISRQSGMHKGGEVV